VRRWLIIIACLAIPVLVVTSAGRVVDHQTHVDPRYSQKCSALIALAQTQTLQERVQSATLVVNAPDAAIEDRICARRVQIDPVHVPPILPPDCQAAGSAALAGHDEAARRLYEHLLRTSSDIATRSCASGGLSRLPPRPSAAKWTTERANAFLQWSTGWLPGGPVELSAATNPAAIGVAWFLTVGLLIVALRQLIRWRRERIAGPVEIRSITGTSDTAEVAVFTELMRDRLAQAGIYPNSKTGSVGELALDVSAALDASGSPGWLGGLVNSIQNAIAVTSGWVLTGTVEESSADLDGQARMVIQLDSAATGETLWIHTYTAETIRDACTDAAFGVYLRLNDNDEVRRRTPSFLRWTELDALRSYHEALEERVRGSNLTAATKLQDAADLQPGNLLIQLELADTYFQLGRGTPDDNALRPAEQGAKEHYRSGLLAALRAVCLNGYSEEAHANLALSLSAVSEQLEWDDTDPVCRQILQLLTRVEAMNNINVPNPIEVDDFRRFFDNLAARHWLVARRRAKWSSVVWVAIWLNRRRTVAGNIWIFRRQRTSTQHLALAAAVATRYDAFAHTATAGVRLTVWQRGCLIRVRFGRWFGLRRLAGQESLVQYNLAAAYALRAEWLRHRHKSQRIIDRNLKVALNCLDRSFFGPFRQISRYDLNYLQVDPDFKALQRSAAFRQWMATYVPKDAVSAARENWRDVFRRFAERSDAASRWWYDHLVQPIPTSVTEESAKYQWCLQVLSWLGDEGDRWAALQSWATNAAATSAREQFEQAIPDPPLNKSRPIGTLLSAVLPGDEAATVEAVRVANLRAWTRLEPWATGAQNGVQVTAQRVLDSCAQRDFVAVKREFQLFAPRYAELWASIAVWAQRPSW